ncbi:MAG: hypothetical protein KBH11_01580 [Bacteroidia bacterium]|nr:hypothetical protein [Bacteroidota bacterium]MBP9081739.1 hypothetical protein [Bacteroidia bacterium]
MGRRVITEDMACRDQSKLIDISQLKQNIYIVKININGTSVKIAKLVIAR